MILDAEQEKIAYAKPNGALLIKGVAGSGKTTAGINKISYLLENFCFEHDDMILYTAKKQVLVNESSYKFIEIDKKRNLTLMDLLKDTKDKVFFISIDDIMSGYNKDYTNISETFSQSSINTQYYLKLLDDCVNSLKDKYSDMIYFDEKYYQFLLSEIKWIKACDYYDEEDYQYADRVGLTLLVPKGPQRLNKNSRSRKAIHELFRLFMEFDGNAFNEIKNTEFRKFTHVIIDECQNLTRVQLDYIISLYQEKSYSSITFIYDTEQKIYPTSWLRTGRSFTTIGFDLTGKSVHLSNSYLKNLKASNQKSFLKGIKEIFNKIFKR